MLTIQFEKAFQDTARFYRCVVSLRSPSPAGQGLLLEGYAAKSFHIKAKTSDRGPTAGFVARDPRLVKGEARDVTRQHARVSAALTCGARVTPLVLSRQRATWLMNAQLMRPCGEQFVEACCHSVRRVFKLVEGEGDAAGMWAVLDDDGSAVEVLANPPHLRGPTDFHKAVTADYDLFGIFPRQQQSINLRPMQPAPRTVREGAPLHRQRAAGYLDSIRRSAGLLEDPDTGNMSHFIKVVVNRLNRAIASEGYRGGDLVQHSDENGNPFSPGQDFPLIFYFPEGDRIIVNDTPGLALTVHDMTARGYAVELNPAFSMPGMGPSPLREQLLSNNRLGKSRSG